MENREQEPVFACEKEMTRKIYIKAYFELCKSRQACFWL